MSTKYLVLIIQVPSIQPFFFGWLRISSQISQGKVSRSVSRSAKVVKWLMWLKYVFYLKHSSLRLNMEKKVFLKCKKNINIPHRDSFPYPLDPCVETHLMGKQVLAVTEFPQWVTGLMFYISAYKALRRLCRKRG